jgi:hypothetical protein
MGECLPRKCKAHSSIPSTTKNEWMNTDDHKFQELRHDQENKAKNLWHREGAEM